MSRLDSLDDIEQFFIQGGNLIEFYRNDPVMAAYDLLRVDLAPVQRIVLRDMWFKNYCIVTASRGFGKSFLLGVNATLHALLYPGYRVGLLAPSFRQCFFNDIKYLPIFTDKGLFTNPIDFYESIIIGTKVQSLRKTNTIKNKWTNPCQKGLIIKTTKGFEIGGLYNHRIMVLNKECDLIYKELKDIDTDDDIVIKKGFNLFGNNNTLPSFEFNLNWRTKDCRIPKELTPDISYWMGLLIGDGCISIDKSGRKNRIQFTNQDQDLIDSFKKYAKEYFIDDDISDRVKKGMTHELEYTNKKLVYFLLECGFTKTNALDKKIPSVINKSSIGCVSSFLSGLMDTDGCIYIQTQYNKKSATIHLSTSSLKLAKEVQAWFLNMGIVSNLSIDKKSSNRKLNNRSLYSKCATSYKVRITNIIDIIKFRDVIGFRCTYKQKLLDDYIDGLDMRRCNNSNIIPNSSFLVSKLVDDCHKLFKYGNISQNKFLGKLKNACKYSTNFSLDRIKSLLLFANEYGVLTMEYYKLKSLIELDLFFVKPIEFIDHTSETIDIEVENEHCYWAGGFINHNSKMVFSEIQKLYNRSPILREATLKQPVRGADSCSLTFKNTEMSNGSFIEALPIGVDGAKIRGSRFYLVQIDELAQMPSDIIDMVIRPMAAVSLEPMKKVREIERIEKLIEAGLATEEDLLDTESANKMIMTSSGYFKFNHMWHRMKSYWKAIKEQGENTEYAVWQVPYQLLPKGFLDMKNVNEAKRTMSSLEFMMEYEAAMASDSEGFFKASLLEHCTRDSGHSVLTHGVSGKDYVLGIDPNQGGSALFGMVVIELGSPNRVVYVRGLKKQTTQEMTKSVQKVLNGFNVVRIYMDAQGGGNAIKDLLAEGYDHQTPVLDMDDEKTAYKNGRRILRLINFSPAWISDANFATLSLLENNRLKFPEPPRTSSEIDEKLYEDVRLLKSQMLSIIVTETSRGVRHFDTPKKGQNKDLYSAIILASYGASELTKDADNVVVPMESDGLIRPHTPGASFTGRKPVGPCKDYMQSAVLKRRV